ncbi:hypothetical protein M3701_00925 [Corynebacterium mucifaciens]|nr:hypothetical protein [Corynebacterium mucifaciens]
MNISYQEVLIFAVIALIIISIAWLIVRIIKGFVSGYNEDATTSTRTGRDRGKSRQ